MEASVKDTIRELADIHNLRMKIHRLKLEGEELIKYGPAKHPEKHGIDTYADAPIEKGPFYNMDPTGRRTGNGEKSHAERGLALAYGLDSTYALFGSRPAPLLPDPSLQHVTPRSARS